MFFGDFLKRVKNNVHIIISMSSFILSLSRRLQEYPAFFDRTTINWFDMWPLKASKKVAEKYLDDIDLVFPLENIFQACSYLHLGTQKTMKLMNNKEDQCKEITNEVEIDLAIALPALEDAQNKLNDQINLKANCITRSREDDGKQKFYGSIR